MTSLVLLLLAADPIGTLYLSSDGGTEKAVKHLRFNGSGVVCSASSTYGVCTLSAGGSGAPTDATYITRLPDSTLSAETAMSALGTGLVVNTTATGAPTIYAGSTCSGGQYATATSTAGALTCSVPTTAVALAANPADCSANQFATTIAANGDLTCAQPSFSNLSGAATDSQIPDNITISLAATATALAADPSDCSAGQFATTIAASGNLTCAAVTYSNLSGSPIAGGASPQVQYNNSGVLAGVNHVESDGTDLRLVGQYPHPAAPTVGKALVYAATFDAGTPILPMENDSYWGVPMPLGLLSLVPSAGLDSITGLWASTRAFPNAWNATTLESTGLGGGAVSLAGTGAGAVWAATNLLTRTKTITETTTGAINQSGSITLITNLNFWRGNASGAGGFLFWTRVQLVTTNSDARTFFGLHNQTGTVSSIVEPSSILDSVYFGGDHGGASGNLEICSNDNSGSATCNTLGSNFPMSTNGAYYDFWLFAAPNASTIEWAVSRLDSAHVASGQITSDLPRNTVQLTWDNWLNTGPTQTSALKLAWQGTVVIFNY